MCMATNGPMYDGMSLHYPLESLPWRDVVALESPQLHVQIDNADTSPDLHSPV